MLLKPLNNSHTAKQETMSKQELLYRVEFIQAGQRYELYARELSQGGLFGFIEIGDFVWDTHTSVVLDPSHEKLKDEFADVTRTYICLLSPSYAAAERSSLDPGGPRYHQNTRQKRNTRGITIRDETQQNTT